MRDAQGGVLRRCWLTLSVLVLTTSPPSRASEGIGDSVYPTPCLKSMSRRGGGDGCRRPEATVSQWWTLMTGLDKRHILAPRATIVPPRHQTLWRGDCGAGQVSERRTTQI